MKKILLLPLLLLFLIQCKKEQLDENHEEIKKVPVIFEMPLDTQRSDFTDVFSSGHINWGNKDKKEYIYLSAGITKLYFFAGIGYQENFILGELFELEGTVDVPANKIVFRGELQQNYLYEGEKCSLHYFGNNGRGGEGTNVTNIYDSKFGLLIGKRVSFSNQTGNIEDLGNYHVASMSMVAEEIKDSTKQIIGFNLKCESFHTINSVAMLDLEGVETLEGSATQLQSYTLMWENEKEHVGRFDFVQGGTYNVSDNAGQKSMIALLPQENADLKCSKGTISFDNGIQQNRLYLGKYGSNIEKAMPLEWE